MWEYDEGEVDDEEELWAVERISKHTGSRQDAMFLVKWKGGDETWLLYHQVMKLTILRDYLDAVGVSDISQLTTGGARKIEGDEQVELGMVDFITKDGGDDVPLLDHPFDTLHSFAMRPFEEGPPSEPRKHPRIHNLEIDSKLGVITLYEWDKGGPEIKLKRGG